MRGNFFTFVYIASIFFIVLPGSIDADDEIKYVYQQPEVQKRSVDVFVEALYWHTSETIDWAFTIENQKNFLKDSFKTLVFDWAPGFRVGMGCHMKHDQWDTQASYTRFHSTANDHAQGSVTSGFLAPKVILLLQPFSTGKICLNLKYNMFDWDVGRNFLSSTHLMLRPSIGLKGGWIKQTIQSSWTNPAYLLVIPVSASENLKQIFQGAGPKCAVSTKWCFESPQKHYFSLIGQFEMDYLWGHWSIQDHFFDNYSSDINVKTSERNFGSFVLHSFLGIGWDYTIKSGKIHYSLKLGYEIEDWFNHCQLFTNTSGSQKNDLIFQGCNLSLNCAF